MTMPLQDMLEGKYEILEKIGEGGIGSVYKVKHRLLEEIRVIKVLRPQAASKEELQRRFLREAKMAIRLKHPNIAQLYDFSVTDEGTAYIVMEYIDGVGLDAILRASGPPSLDLTIEFSRQALVALGYLHSHKFVHRDISPDNMMLAADHSGGPVIKLIDLGIAKNLEAVAQLTQTGVFLGKVRYSSPEQFSAKAGSEELDHRSDIYSFGVMLYQLLTGEYPFEGESFTELAGCHLFQAPRPFDKTDGEGRVPKGLRETVLKALEKEPDNRFASTAAFAEALEEFRNPEQALEEELDETIKKTLAALPRLAEVKSPGSTQSRLDRDFGLVTTPEPSKVLDLSDQRTAVADPGQLAKDVVRIDKLVAAGKHAKAQRALGNALAKHGKADALVKFSNLLAEAPTTVTTPGAARLFPSKIVGIGAAALLAIAAVAWFVSKQVRGPQATDEVAEAVAVDLGERWDPDLSEPDLTFRVIPEPPNGQEQTTAEAPVTRPTTLPAGGPLPRGAGQPGPGTEGGPPPGPRGDQPPPEHRPPPGPEAGPPPTREFTTEVFQPGELGVVAPVLLSLPTPKLPSDHSPKTATRIMVTALVDEHGNVLSTKVKRPSFKRRLKEAAMEAAKGAKFRPAVRNGVAGRMYTYIPVDFAAG